MLKCGARYNIECGSFGSALHLATRRSNLIIVKEFMRLGENPNRKDPEGNTPLHVCISNIAVDKFKSQQVVECLLENGADPNMKNVEGWAPVHIAARKKGCSYAVKWVVEYNRAVRELHGTGEQFKVGKRGGAYKWTALHIAAYSEDIDLVAGLWEAGVDVLKRSVSGLTAKRMVNRPGLTLKMLEKLERQYIKEKVLVKCKTGVSRRCEKSVASKEEGRETVGGYNRESSMGDMQLSRIREVKHVRNASRNKFSFSVSTGSLKELFDSQSLQERVGLKTGDMGTSRYFPETNRAQTRLESLGVSPQTIYSKELGVWDRISPEPEVAVSVITLDFETQEGKLLRPCSSRIGRY